MIANDKSGVLALYLEMIAIAQKPYRDAVDMDLAEIWPRNSWPRAGRDNQDHHNEFGRCVYHITATLVADVPSSTSNARCRIDDQNQGARLGEG